MPKAPKEETITFNAESKLKERVEAHARDLHEDRAPTLRRALELYLDSPEARLTVVVHRLEQVVGHMGARLGRQTEQTLDERVRQLDQAVKRLTQTKGAQ